MEHKHKRFKLELLDLSARLAQMGDIVIEQLETALRSLTEHDIGASRIVIDRDITVNRMDIELEETCLQLLALHQPVAGDLRLITAAMKITTELERIGDRAVNICEAVHDPGERDTIGFHTEISQMGTLATAMVRDSLAAFARRDRSAAARVIKKDREFDVLLSEAFPRFVTSLAKDPGRAAHDTKLAFLSKDLGEVSEHATNIAEVVTFLVDGKQITHMDIHERRGAH